MDWMQNKLFILQFSGANIVRGVARVDEINQFGKSRVRMILTVKMTDDECWFLRRTGVIKFQA